MKLVAAIFSFIMIFPSLGATWSDTRFSSFLRNSSRFVKSDYDDGQEDDVRNRNRDAIPLFRDVMDENEWTTNDLISALVGVVSNGLIAANWESLDTRRSVVVAARQLSDINHPSVTNYFHSIVADDLRGLEMIVIPALFKYTCLEQKILDDLRGLCVQTNKFDRVAPTVAWDMLDCLASMPELEREAAKIRVAKFMYFSSRQISSSQTWQDEQLAKLIPDYSNSVQRLEQVRYLMLHSSRSYERKKATEQFNRLNAIPTNSLKDISWILPDN